MQKFIQDNLQYLIDVRNKNRKTNIDNYLDDYLTKNKVYIQDSHLYMIFLTRNATLSIKLW